MQDTVMRAMVLEKQKTPLQLRETAIPVPSQGELLLRVACCGVCRTDLHIVDGELPHPKLPLIPGHQIVARVEDVGKGVSGFSLGDRVGVPWLQGTCGSCAYCTSGRENLCDKAVFTGYTVNGGYAEYCVANSKYCFPLPSRYDDIHSAPLLCAGLIGYRAYRLTEGAKKIGFYGFGSSAHILCQVARAQGREVYAFVREGDEKARKLALEVGAVWAGGSTQPSPVPLDAAIIFASVGPLVPKALKDLAKGGVIICAGIHMSDIPAFPYDDLWGERVIRSVANLTRQDGEEFLKVASSVPIVTQVTIYPLEEANRALADMREGRLTGAAVLSIAGG